MDHASGLVYLACNKLPVEEGDTSGRVSRISREETVLEPEEGEETVPPSPPGVAAA